MTFRRGIYLASAIAVLPLLAELGWAAWDQRDRLADRGVRLLDSLRDAARF
jgi:hypothetical protein